MSVADLKAIVADIIDRNCEFYIEHGKDIFVKNSDEVADRILKRIQDTHDIAEKSAVYTPKPVDPNDMDKIGQKISQVRSWEGYVDRQSGAFTDQEILDRQTWR